MQLQSLSMYNACWFYSKAARDILHKLFGWYELIVIVYLYKVPGL